MTESTPHRLTLATQHDFTRPLVLILGDQLSHSLPSITLAPAESVIAFCEVEEEGRYVPHHPHKIVMMLAAMRHHARELRDCGWQVHESRLDDPGNLHSLTEEAERLATLYNCDGILVTRPGEWRLLEAFKRRQRVAQPRWEILEDTRFFTTPADFERWADGRKQLRMEYFYREQRRASDLLMEGSEPAGGKFNHDHDNREPIPEHFTAPAPPTHAHHEDEMTSEVLAMVEARFGKEAPEDQRHFGTLEHFNWAVTRQQAKCDLTHFLNHCLADFGRYQDAIEDSDPFLFHSRLSAALNIGLLSPQEVCEAVDSAWRRGEVPVNSAEGFIRQILGWREYVRGIYWTRMPAYKQENQLGGTRDLPEVFWRGNSGMRCIDQAVASTRDHAYSHHIRRLMVTGNFALLCGVKPEALCDWYLAVYIDACEWVELPNTLGMVLHADGGLMGSKPYCASGKYIDRMSNHCDKCRYSPKQVTGTHACPFNSLYWHFIERHREQLAGNPRMSLVYGSWRRMKAEKREALLQQADAFLAQLDSAPGYGRGTHREGYAADHE
ncbi:cryptochrome/photolyase family protein [Cobetia sp. L2A1]|uniref:cryptochrome/photolyase family protein n=1 Tax=Cobetia sp. L2A1 TaxID=2686360 RepID=UPI001E3EC571|nr:cryptochrome/photolyase family protein [Cobetia sp. L2A1]